MNVIDKLPTTERPETPETQPGVSAFKPSQSC